MGIWNAFVRCILLVTAGHFHDNDINRTDVSEDLKKLNAIFLKGPHYRLVMDEKPRPTDLPGHYVWILSSWTGGQANLQLLNKLGNVVDLSISHPDLNDKWCAELKHLSKLRGLFLSGKEITNNGLAELKELQHIEALGLYRTSISDEGLSLLKGYSRLRVCFNIVTRRVFYAF